MVRQAAISGSALAILLVVLTSVAGQSKPAPVTSEDPVEIRQRLVEIQLAIVQAVPSNTETLTAEQTSAVNILAKFRAEEAAPELVRIITAKSPVELGPMQRGSQYGGREQRGGEYVANEAIKEIGLPGVRAILEDIVARRDAAPGKTRLEIYASTIIAIFPPGDAGLDYVRAFQAMAPPSRKKLYEPLLQAMDKVKKPRIQFEEESQTPFLP